MPCILWEIGIHELTADDIISLATSEGLVQETSCRPTRSFLFLKLFRKSIKAMLARKIWNWAQDRGCMNRNLLLTLFSNNRYVPSPQ